MVWCSATSPQPNYSGSPTLKLQSPVSLFRLMWRYWTCYPIFKFDNLCSSLITRARVWYPMLEFDFLCSEFDILCWRLISYPPSLISYARFWYPLPLFDTLYRVCWYPMLEFDILRSRLTSCVGVVVPQGLAGFSPSNFLSLHLLSFVVKNQCV